MRERVEWSIQVPIFSDPTILRQLGLVIGIPFGLIFVIMLLSGATPADGGAPLEIITRPTMPADDRKNRIHLDIAPGEQARQNRVINALTAVLGLLSGKPAVAGAGVLAQSRQDVLVKWESIKKTREYPRRNTIMLYGGFAQNIAVFCTPENYREVREYIASKVRSER